jgi:hypothetical protein
MEILVVGPGVDDREVGVDLGLDFGARRSETRLPAAEGGALTGGGVADLVGGVLDGPSCEGVEVWDLAGI